MKLGRRRQPLLPKIGSSPRRALALGLLGARVGYGVALLAAPGRVAGNRWLGTGAREPAAQVALRGLGAREIGLHALASAAVLSGAPVRPLLGASLAGDLTDIASTVKARAGLPPRSVEATVAVAGGSAALTVVIAALLGR